ncbi:trimethylguanosine synthase-like [Morone saxatilis]|uniref:trimethylguanosine synthase-like n=1 Tax=Morone saxatilis TaxID=34816 RepID=UPI0015E21472|nr:trimethylguanosine synthase-like [Morone saxatilis]
MDGGSKHEPETKPPFLGVKEKRRNMKSAKERSTDVVEEESSNSLCSLDAERRKCSQPGASFSSPAGTVDSEREKKEEEEEEEEEKEQPDRQFKFLEIPDFLLSDAPEGNSELRTKDGQKPKKKKKKKKKRGRKQQVPAEMAAKPELAKYWAQRYRLFSRFDEGIRLDRGQSALYMHAYKCVVEVCIRSSSG